MSSGAGALHSKCPRGPRGSQGAGGLESWTSLRRSLTSRAPRVAAAWISFAFCLFSLCFGVARPRRARYLPKTRAGAPEWAPAVTASHNPETEPRATPCTGRVPRLHTQRTWASTALLFRRSGATVFCVANQNEKKWRPRSPGQIT